MPANMKTGFEPFKGQSVDTRLNDGRFVHNVRKAPSGSPTRDTGALYPYMPKSSGFFFDLPKIQDNPFERVTAKYSAEYGEYIELGAIGDPNYNGSTGVSVGTNIPNRGFTDSCMVYDRPKYTANYLYKNVYTHNAYIDQKQGVKGVVRNAEEASKIAMGITMSMAQENSIKRKAIMSRMFSDCIDGFTGPMIDGMFKSGMNAVGVAPITDDNMEIEGWAGKVIHKSDMVVAGLDVATNNGMADAISTADALALAKDIRSSLTYGRFLGNYYVPGGVRLDAFTSPVLVIEEAVLDALNDSFINATVSTGGSTNPLSFNTSWSNYVKDGKNVEILTTDIFEDLPLLKDGTKYKANPNRLLCALVEPDMFKDFVYSDDMMSDICIQPRGTVYDYQRIEALGVDRRRPSVVFTAPLASAGGS